MIAPPLVSIILPVYNSETTLEACLLSACSQEGINLELICIDDGSQDNSRNILDKWASQDSRIRIIHQENAGVSTARNRGLHEINGEYFTLLDADDRLEPGYLNAMLSTALRQEADAVISGWTRLSQGCSAAQAITKSEKELVTGAAAIAALPPAAWGRLYSTELLQRSNARYPTGVRYGEDMAFNFAINAVAHRIILHPSVGYLYVDTPTSASNTRMQDKVMDMTKALAYLVSAYESQGMDILRLELLTHYAALSLRRIRSMAPHHCQRDCAHRIRDILMQVGITAQDLTSLKAKDAACLRSILRGGSGLGPGYYWRRFTRMLRGKN